MRGLFNLIKGKEVNERGTNVLILIKTKHTRSFIMVSLSYSLYFFINLGLSSVSIVSN